MNAISNRIRFLIGVPEKYLAETDYSPEDLVLRHLCNLRSCLIENFTELNVEFRDNQKNIGEIEGIKQLVTTVRADNIKLSDHPGSLSRVIMEVNDEIAKRAELLFDDGEVPGEWLNNLFVIKDNSIDGVREVLRKYKKYRNVYPWQKYMNVNWALLEEEVRNQNVLFDDETLYNVLTILNTRKTTGVYDFIGQNQPIVVVDCENSDPQRLYNTLKPVLPLVRKIILINGTKGNMLWDEFVLFAQTQTKVEHVRIARLKEQKSLVDFQMVSQTCKEYYMNNARSFVFASSDSDIWALICAVPEADIFVISERCKSGDFLEDALTQQRIPFCYMEDQVADTTELMDSAMNREVAHFLAKGCDKRRAVLNAVSKLKVFPSEQEMNRLFEKEY